MHWQISEGAHGTRPLLWTKSLHFHAVLEKWPNSILRPPFRSWHPYGKSWICWKHLRVVVVINIISKQESPPAWTQEAYRPPCSEYSFCCPTWVPPPDRVPPHPDLARGGTWPGYPPSRVPPWPGYPPGQGTPEGTRVPPRPGYPPGQGTSLARVPPRLDLAGYPPPRLDLAGYPPAASWHSGKCCKALWDMGTPPPGVNKLTKWNYYLPVVLRTRAVINSHFYNRYLNSEQRILLLILL